MRWNQKGKGRIMHVKGEKVGGAREDTVFLFCGMSRRREK